MPRKKENERVKKRNEEERERKRMKTTSITSAAINARTKKKTTFLNITSFMVKF